MTVRTINCWVLLRSLGLLAGLLTPVQLIADEALPPLLNQSKTLACAQTESVAKKALSAFWDIEDEQKAFPDEGVPSIDNSTLHAATLDIVLKSLLETAERYPGLRNQVERTLLKWNYCDVFQEGVFYNLERNGNQFVRVRAAANSPENWQGFKALGFLGEHEDRFIPNILNLDQQGLRSDYEWLFHRIFREQCFPHPDTAELFDSAGDDLQENIVTPIVTDAEEYPYSWNAECVVPRDPPVLETRLTIETVSLVVPKLTSQVQLLPVAHLVPRLLTVVVLKPNKVKIPKLVTKILIEPSPLSIPKLSTKVELDKPKVVAKKPKLIKKSPVKLANNKGQYQVNHVGNANGGYYNTNKAKAIGPPKRAYQAKVVSPSKAVVLDSKASLLERVLGGLSSGGNVLIVDKIQLTVNEYNGTVETAISSSDIGSTLHPNESQTIPVKGLIQALPVARKKSTLTAAKPVTKKYPTNKLEKLSPYLLVPELQSMLLVSEAVVIRRPKLLKIPDKKTQAKKTKVKKRYARNQNKSLRKDRKSSGSSSLFIYEPYPNKNRKPNEKSIEQLLLEYQAYEERRKSGYTAKKKLTSNHAEGLQVPKLTPQVFVIPVTSEKRRVPSLKTKLWIEQKRHGKKLNVPALSSEVRIYRTHSTQTVEVPILNTKVVKQTSKVSKKKVQSGESSPDLSFEFSSDYLKDEVFEKTLLPENTATPVSTPTSLSSEAPLPYVIDGRFTNGLIAPSSAQNASPKKIKKAMTKKKTLGLAGNVYLKQSLKNSAKAVGGSINRKLIKDSYWFARVGWNYTLEESDEPFSYSWGIGYSDWHSGTFSAQLNNWGPIKPEEGLALEKAVANFGYSVKSEFLKNYRLSLSGSINVPIEGNSSLIGNLRWSPKDNWYINASVSQPLEGDGTPKWTYGFGYSNWRPNKFSLQYSNYGPNEILDHNYKKSGTWSLSYNWKL